MISFLLSSSSAFIYFRFLCFTVSVALLNVTLNERAVCHGVGELADSVIQFYIRQAVLNATLNLTDVPLAIKCINGIRISSPLGIILRGDIFMKLRAD